MGKTKQILSSLVILASSSASASTAAVTSNDAAHHHQQTTEHHHIATYKEIPSHEHKNNNHHHHRKLGKAGKAETTTTYTQQISSAANGSGNYGWWPSATEPPVPPPPPPQMGVGWQQQPPPQWGQPQPQPVEPVHHGQNGGHTGPHWTAISTTGGKSGKKTSGGGGKAGKKLDSWSWGAEATEESSGGAWWEGSQHPSISSKSSKSSKSTKHSKSAEEEWGGGWSWPITIGDMDPSSQDTNEDGDDDDDEEEGGGGLLTTVVDVALENPDFSTLVTALKAANLVDALSGVGPFTVFAPTNEAFAALPEGTLDTLLSPENIDQLSNILRYHVVSGNFPSSTLTTTSVETLLNGPLADIIVDGMNVMVNDAHVILPDIIADNGVVHVIDKVLLPPPPENMASRYSSLSSGSSSSTTSTTSQSSSVSKPNGGQASSSSSSSWWGAAGSSSSSSWWGAATTSGSKGGKTSGGWTTNPHVHHGPHPGVGAAAWHPSPKSGKTSKSSKSKSAKAYYHVAGGNTGWSAGHGSGSKDTVSMGDDWWGGSSKGPEEDMGDDWWGGPCPPGKAGKNCDVDAAVPSAEPTPCGKAGKDDCDHLEEDEEEVEDFLEEEVEDSEPGMVDELVESFTNRNPAGGGNTIGDLIPITPKPSLSPSPPPSSSWPTWTPTALPTTAVDALRSGSGTWFQSGRAYDVEMSHYRVESLNQNGAVQGKTMDNAAGGRSSRWSSWGVMVMSGAGIVMSYLTMMLLE